MNSVSMSREINIHGDCVWGIFETLNKSDIDGVISITAKINSMIKILNYKLVKKGYSTISIGIGADYGRALMIKAGYSGSGINDVIWMGDVVNSASNLCGTAHRHLRKTIVISNVIYSNLNDDNKKLFSSFYDNGILRYEGDIVNTVMDNWYKDNCK
jgi:class 3 adenylate cyclase